MRPTATDRYRYYQMWVYNAHDGEKLTSAQVVETAVIVNNNRVFRSALNPAANDHTRQTTSVNRFESTLVTFCYGSKVTCLSVLLTNL